MPLVLVTDGSVKDCGEGMVEESRRLTLVDLTDPWAPREYE